MKIYAISDTHFSHDRERIERPEGFEEKILTNIRKLSGDILIHCGDFCIGEDVENHLRFMDAASRFRKKILVRGNHDNKSDAWYYAHGWDFVCEMMWARYFGMQILFSHMPVYYQDQANAFTPHFPFQINVHGHLHGNNHRGRNELYDYEHFLDLAPDIHDFAPVNIEHIKNIQKAICPKK